MKIIVLTVGLPGSGKSTWADRMSELDDIAVVGRDPIRELLFGTEYMTVKPDPKKEKIVSDVLTMRVKHLLANGKTVILDNTHMSRASVEFAKNLALDAVLVAKYFDTPVSECKRRNAARSRVVPEHVIDRMAKTSCIASDGRIPRLAGIEALST